MDINKFTKMLLKKDEKHVCKFTQRKRESNQVDGSDKGSLVGKENSRKFLTLVHKTNCGMLLKEGSQVPSREDHFCLNSHT